VSAAVADPLARHSATPAEIKALIAIEQRDSPFLAYRDHAGALRLVSLSAAGEPFVVGRRAGVDVQLAWDSEVSGVHAELRCIGGEWTVIDNDSTNKTFVNGSAIERQRLRDGDRMIMGSTVLVFREPIGDTVSPTTTGKEMPGAEALTQAQRRVLVALCRPKLTEGDYHAPASNKEIAEELFLSVDAVKTHLRTMFMLFDRDRLPQNQKRAGLAELALRTGLVSKRDL
jgi:pSer/pThr/pTyr-binding forkhead associated (FHA) protein